MEKLKLKLTASAILCILLLSGFTPFLNSIVNKLNSNPNPNPSLTPKYLHLDEVSKTSYEFYAQGACYILVEIEGIDFTYFTLDEDFYEVSYGLNIFSVEFSNNPYKTYTIEIPDYQYFKTITVEPLVIAEGEIDVNLIQDTAVNFQAGGPISILTRINFSYNWLRVELHNGTGSGTLLKRIHNTTVYPEVDPLFYCLFIERGTYIRYDVNLEPGDYTLLFQGNGSIEYKIMVNSDWDEDMFKDVDEIQQNDMYEFDLNPTHPDMWGFFEKAEENLLNSSIEEEGFTEGYFSFYIPDIYINNNLTIRVNYGTFKEIEVDMDSLFFEGEIFNSNRDAPSAQHMYGRIDPGWHHISYLHKANYSSDIEFLITNNMGFLQEIKVIQIAEFRDTDGDGIKDIEEYSSNLNPAKTDTDEDGLPDNLDGSPLAKLVLDPNQIHQMVLSVNNSKDTLINIQIKKPENDYSTNGVPRLWIGAVNVSIYPVLRLFGKKYEHPFDSQINNLDKPALEWLWGKSVNCSFKSDEAILANYNQNGIGDTLPNPNDPESEFFFIFPKPASETIDYDIMLPKGHSSKDDGLLDLRFDFIWVITEYDYDTGETLVLHYYDFEEPIIVQSMAMREISSVHYTLGNPDCFIENQILWTLTQNPSLGSFEDFGVYDDVELNGTIDYFGLPEIISEYRLNVGYKVNESEVLYMKGFYQNHDILNQIYVKTLINPDFETFHQGNYSECFSSYAISNLYENQSYVLGDSEIQGETKTLYQFYSSEKDQQSTIIMGVPIAMERDISSQTLEISQIQGFLDTLEEIPWDGSQLSNAMTLLHQTYIERDVPATGIPLVHFEEGIDVYKEYMDNRHDEVEQSHRFFTAEPEMPAELFMNYIDVFWENIAQMKDNLSVLYDFVINNSNIFVPEADRVDLTLMENIINKITEFQQHSCSEMSSYTEFFQFSQDFYFDVMQLVDLYQGKESTDFVKAPFFKKISSIVKLTRVIPKMAKLMDLFSRSDKIVNNKGVMDSPKQNIESKSTKNPSAESQKVKTHYKSRMMGAACAILGLVMVGFSIYEIHMLASGNKTAYQGIKAIKALCNLVAGALLFFEGLLLFASSFAKTTASALKSGAKSMGKVSLVLSVIMFGLDLYKFIDRVVSGEEVDLFMEIFSLAMSAALIAVGIAVAVGFCSTGVGLIIGAIIAAVTILVSWVTKYVNAPDLEFIEADCRTYFPDSTILRMRRNGGLEKGDKFSYHLKVKNTGRNKVWMRAKLRITGDSMEGAWTDWAGDWDDGYKKGKIMEETLTAAIYDASPNLNYELVFEADWRHWYLFIPVREDLADEEWKVPMNMHALENSISEFYDHTTDYGSINDLKSKFNKSLEEYRYWDALQIGNLIIKATQINQKISLSKFEHIEASSSLASREIDFWLPRDVYKYQTSNYDEWEDLLSNFYAYHGEGGWAAWTRPIKEVISEPYWGDTIIIQPDTYDWNLMGYDRSNGILYSNRDPEWGEVWMETKKAGLSDAFEYRELVNDLTIKSNLSTNLRKQHIEVDPVTRKAEVNLKMNIKPYWTDKKKVWTSPFSYKWIKISDGEKIVTFYITPPEGYVISPKNLFTERLDSTISFNLISDTPGVRFGLYFFNVSVFFEGELIYKESVPFKVGGFSCLEFETYTATEPLVPGQLFTMVDLRNLGTFTELANITVEGIPESFIYKELYPDNFINGSLLLGLNPGDTIPGLIIHPPRHHSSAPGIYSYTFHAQDHIFTNFNEIIHGTFEVAEFYDMNFQLISITPEDNISDYQKAVYTFNLTNLGNVNQIFHISYDDVSFANEALNKNDILLEPGKWDIVNLTLSPIGWGTQTFSINATSIYNSSRIAADITIWDDDVNPPNITSFEIIETPININFNFEVLNEIDGDDMGLSYIKVFVDDELVLDYVPYATETCFSFTITDIFGDWFMEIGTHDIGIEVVDNDFDVPNDALDSFITATFETSLEDMYEYIYWQLQVLKEYIEDNVYSCFSRSWSKKISCTQWQLDKAFEYVENGYITCALFHDAVAKVLVQIVEFRAEIFENHHCIDHNIIECIINSTRIIRNNLVLLMGYTTGADIGLQIALTEIDLLNLNDFIREEINLCCRFRWCLNNLIRSATYMLETALIKISMDYNIECTLTLALYKLKKAECKVHWLLWKGWITQELADTTLFKLNQAQEDIEAILITI